MSRYSLRKLTGREGTGLVMSRYSLRKLVGREGTGSIIHEHKDTRSVLSGTEILSLETQMNTKIQYQSSSPRILSGNSPGHKGTGCVMSIYPLWNSHGRKDTRLLF